MIWPCNKVYVRNSPGFTSLQIKREKMKLDHFCLTFISLKHHTGTPLAHFLNTKPSKIWKSKQSTPLKELHKYLKYHYLNKFKVLEGHSIRQT